MYKIFEKIRNKFNKFEYIPKVKNFNQANLFCQNKNSGVYESELLCKYRFEKLDNYLKKNENLFNPLAINMLLVCIAYFLKNNERKFPKIIDFGGACGENILFLETIFGNDIFENSWIIETPGQVEESRNWKFAQKLNFSSDINTILKKNKIDIFFSSAAINYLENPYDMLSFVEKFRLPLICLTRNNFSLKPKPFIQVSNLSENGFGEHLEKFGNPKVWYPSQTINEKKVKDIFLKNSYELIIDKSIDDSGIINKKTSYSKDLLFKVIQQ